MVRNRAENVQKWTLEELITILLRQFKRLLAERGQELTEAEIKTLAFSAVGRSATSPQADRVRAALRELVAESLDVLASWGLGYAQSLRTGMNTLTGWETTADFLTLANEKGNAELRISAGASLLACLGDVMYADKLWDTWQHGADDAEDVDAVIARRALLFAAGIRENADDWEALLRDWLAQHTNGHDDASDQA